MTSRLDISPPASTVYRPRTLGSVVVLRATSTAVLCGITTTHSHVASSDDRLFVFVNRLESSRFLPVFTTYLNPGTKVLHRGTTAIPCSITISHTRLPQVKCLPSSGSGPLITFSYLMVYFDTNEEGETLKISCEKALYIQTD